MITDKNRIGGVAPAVVLINPKKDYNVASVLRMCSCFGIPQLWWTGTRVTLDVAKGERLPREERMRDYEKVTLVDSFDQTRVLDRFPGATPVCVELVKGATLLPHLVHPRNPVYIFGPEDGHVPQAIKTMCHHFIAIPTHHCLNLANAVGLVLYDRLIKQMQSGEVQGWTMDDFLHEQRGWYDPDTDPGIQGLKASEESRFNAR